tara:strand:- start:478 stop:606 length:129 start_codon:yes stop_codon:yes gene_type:complete
MLSEIINNYLPIDWVELRGDNFYNNKISAIKKELSLINQKHG